MVVTKLSGKATNFGIKTVDLAASIRFSYYVCYQYRRGKDTERPELCKNQEIKVLSLGNLGLGFRIKSGPFAHDIFLRGMKTPSNPLI